MTRTDLALHIQQTPMIDTHEHTATEQRFVQEGPDVLQAIVSHYMAGDLRVAGASQQAIDFASDGSNPDVETRLAGIKQAWDRCRHTGYGRAARMVAKEFFDIEDLTVDALRRAAPRIAALRQPGQRLAILRDKANLDHVQIDSQSLACLPDASGPDFFLSDISWAKYVIVEDFTQQLHEVTGIHVRNLSSLREAFTVVFAKYGPCAIAVKTQHAYHRTLQWRQRSDGEAEPCLQKFLAHKEMSLDEKLCLGDWCLARGVELATQHNLPVKIHTGYYAGHSRMITQRIHPGLLCDLLIAYPNARFVLMHAGYPYSHELIALAKHFPNVYMDLCWAWAMDPFSTAEAVRKVIHGVPSNKLFAFGGDTFWPMTTWAYATQARTWLTRSLQAEIADGLLTEPEAIDLATQWMIGNQRQCFDIEGARAAIAQAAAGRGTTC